MVRGCPALRAEAEGLVTTALASHTFLCVTRPHTRCAQRLYSPHRDPERAAAEARLNRWVDRISEVPPGRRVWFCPSHAYLAKGASR